MFDADMITPTLFNTIKYVGSHNNLPKEGHYGDLILCDKEKYLWIGDKWESLGDINAMKETTKVEHIKIRPQLCQCCGAALHGDTCDYCGVEYR